MMILPSINRLTRTPWESMERDMRRLLRHLDEAPGAEFPPVNIWNNAEKSYLTAELPGIDPGKLEITVQNNTVTLRGSREPLELQAGEEWLRRERQTGSFVRSFGLPFNVDPDQVSARYEHGVLTVTLPRIEEEKPRKITING